MSNPPLAPRLSNSETTSIVYWSRSRIINYTLVAMIVASWFGLAAFSAVTNAPVWHEPVQLMAGLTIWRFGRLDVYDVNPPLVRAFAALPVLQLEPSLDPSIFDRIATTDGREEFVLAQQFVRQNGPGIRKQVICARLPCLIFGFIGAVVCWRWGLQLFGAPSGLVALSLWCFSPWVLGHGATIMNDVPAAAAAIGAMYFLWRWLKSPQVWGAVATAIAVGVAVLCKFTLLILYPMALILWLIYRWGKPTASGRTPWLQESGMLVLMLLLSIYTINLGYVFRGSFKPLDEFKFHSMLLSGYDSFNRMPMQGSNRFIGTWFGKLRVPFPEDMLHGIDTQRIDFERGLPSYLGGEWSGHGWWYYYLYSIVIKSPVGTIALVIGSIAVTFLFRGFSACWRDELVLLVPLVGILVFVSSQAGISVHSRYVIPVLPFMFVWTSKIGRAFTVRNTHVAVFTVLASLASVGSSLSVYPFSLSYFNEFVGGPTEGPKYLLDSNIDWGQDLYRLSHWLEEHRVHLDGLAYHGIIDPDLASIPETPLPNLGPAVVDLAAIQDFDTVGPKPGWYALSVNVLYDASKQFRYFLRLKPYTTIGYSIYIYRVDLDEANQLRRALGLPAYRI